MYVLNFSEFIICLPIKQKLSLIVSHECHWPMSAIHQGQKHSYLMEVVLALQ